MSSVDNRAVHMTFDNAAFEKNLADTMKSMDSLKKSLDFTNAKRSFADLGTAAHGFNLGGLGAHVEGISAKFLALGTIAVTTLANIVNRAVDAGINLAKSLTLAPVMSGFQEYETNINSIQTILANTESKGSTLEDVNGALDQLNDYADKTIYNFSQMTRNIGTFTAAGVDLDTSVNAIKGIANLAAISGSNSEQASTAMYQLSQAIASGSVKLMDWNSVVNAGMGGEVFQKALFETGKAMGTLTDVPMSQTFEQWKDAGNSFRGSLESGWATAEVLTNTLQAFTGDLSEAQLVALGYTKEQAVELAKIGQTGQDAATKVKTLTQLIGTVKEAVGSGWSSSFRIIFGDFEQAKETFSGFSDAIGEMVKNSADRRNKLLQGWADLGGRTKLIEGIKNAFGALKQILDTVSTQFHRFFGTLDSETLYNITEAFANFMERIRSSEDFFDRINTAFGAVFAGLKIGVEIVKGVIGVFTDLFQHFAGGGAGKTVLDFIDRFSLMIIGLHTALVTNGGLDRIFETITERLISFGEALKNPGQLLSDIKDAVKGFFKGIDFGSFDGIVEAIERVKTYILDLFDLEAYDFNFKIPESISNFFDSLFGNVDDNTSNSLELGGGLDRISSALSTLWDITKKIGDGIGKFFDILGDIGGWVASAGGNVIDFFENIGPNIQQFIMSDEFDKLLEFLQTLGVLLGGAGIAGIAKNGLKVDMTGGFLTELANAFKKGGIIDVAKGNLAGLTGVLDAMQTSIKAGALLKIAEAVALLTVSVVALSFVNPESLAKSLTAMSVGFAQLMASFAVLNAMASGPKSGLSFAAVSSGLVALATAMLILSGAIIALSTLSWEELARGLTGAAGALIILVGATKLISGGGVNLIAVGIGLGAVAVSMGLLAGAIKIFSLMSWEEIGKGMAAVAAGLLIIAGALQLMPATTILIGPGLAAVGFALTEMGAALLIFATMSWEEIGKGMTVLAGGLLIIAGAMNLMPASTILTGPGLIAISTGLVILAAALKEFGSMKWEEIGKAMTVLASSLLILAGAMALMQGGIPGAIAVGVMAASLLILVKALKEFAKLSWKELGKGLAGIAAALGVLGLAALALSPVIGNIFLLGVALLALGAGFALIGVGASLLAEAFQIIAAAGTAGIDVLMYAIDQFLIRLPEIAKQLAVSILDMADMILAAAPGLIEKLGRVIGELLILIRNNADEFGLAATAWILAVLKTIRDSSPDIVKTGFQILLDFLHGLEANIKEVTVTVLKIIAEFLEGLAKGAPDFAEAGAKVIANFIHGLNEHVDEIVEEAVIFIAKVLEGIARSLDDLITAAIDVIEAFIKGIGDNVDDIVSSGGLFIVNLIIGIGKSMNLIVTQGTLALIAFISGIGKSMVLITRAAFAVIIEFMHGMADAIRDNDQEIADAALDLMEAIVEGLTTAALSVSIQGAIKAVGVGIGKGILNAAKGAVGANSPATEFIKLGNDVVDGLVLGINSNSQKSDIAGEKMGRGLTDSFRNALAETSRIIENSTEFKPTITPVLDLTQVQANAGLIGGLLGNQQLTAGVSVQAANQLLAETTPDRDEDKSDEEKTRTITFIQTNNSPEALNTATVYKRTRSQIELAKKELEKV